LTGIFDYRNTFLENLNKGTTNPKGPELVDLIIETGAVSAENMITLNSI